MNETIQNIKDKNDIVEVISEYISLNKKGRNFWGICPFHEDTSPSMSVSPEKQFFKCFACNASGDVISFVTDYEKISRHKAIEKLAKRVGVEYKSDIQSEAYTQQQQKQLAVIADAMTFYQYQLDVLEEVKPYLEKRLLTKADCEKFVIGYASKNRDDLKKYLLQKGHDEAALINASLLNSKGFDFFTNRLIFGITNKNGDVIAMSGRALDDNDVKYLNSAESLVFKKSATLYNFFNAFDLAERERKIFICEGQMDAIALAKANISNSVAILGTALTPEHMPLLKNYQVVLCFDADEAGQNATFKSLLLLFQNNIDAHVLQNDKGKDVDEVLKKEGVESLRKLVSTTISGIEFIYKKTFSDCDKNSPSDIEKAIKNFDQFLRHTKDIVHSFYVTKISDEFKIEKDAVKNILSAPQKTFSYNEPSKKISTSTNDEIKLGETYASSKVKRYDFILIKSLVSKPLLLNYFIKNDLKVYFLDRQMEKIVDFLVARKKESKNITVDLKTKEAFKEVNKEVTATIDSEAEVDDIVKRINEQYYEYYINANLVKLKDKALSSDEQAKILKLISELKAAKKEGK